MILVLLRDPQTGQAIMRAEGNDATPELILEMLQAAVAQVQQPGNPPAAGPPPAPPKRTLSNSGFVVARGVPDNVRNLQP